MRYGIVNGDGFVINVISWDGVTQWQPPAGCKAIRSDAVDIGDYWDGERFTKFYELNHAS